MRVFINGFGRIGRSVLRAWAEAPARWPGLEIVGVNDIEAPEMLAYLFEYDSVFGPWRGSVTLEEGALVINGTRIALHRADDISTLDLSDVDLVMECTGRADCPQIAGQGIAGGASRVLISGPAKAAEITVVLGANDAALNGQKIVSNASCTTNALAPLARLIDVEFGIVTGSMTTVHCYTGSQPTVDKPRGPMERSRAAALSMVPTTTSAGKLMEEVLPDLAGRLIAQAVRVPTASVSAVDLAVTVKNPATVEQVNAMLRDAGGVIGTTGKPLVSTDLRARPESVVMALPETRATAHGLIRVFGWYDNEWGFSNRMLDMALRMG
ncbi:type I glyceraldehyde-3-phosphate dehydrogenase [Thioclava nitratireducens]|uniref:type I glyceraldehyde-3-phosphate dehydrogenase n=1 Tax=Thioclava nitratireducens TaxID=1915078 RepID=UPI002481511C|nr:glyceraldehyde 3-phosphate dehydrogenase NAD-binding domain-containing protein [Thioclava nitratireducens]WGT49330.1 glyceraldehyde 3-phosphate dehydrogenase NAD-binding domain-containing protein [Thioclava nitratireducens]